LSQLLEIKLLPSVFQFYVYIGLSPFSSISAKFMALLCRGNRFIAVQARVIASLFLDPVFRILLVQALLFCSFYTSLFWLNEICSKEGLRRIFFALKILSTPFFGVEVKPSVPCRSFTACKTSLNVTCKSTFRQNYRTFLAHSSTFRHWVLSRGDAWWRKLERLTKIAQ
jgi:hypothetical protein